MKAQLVDLKGFKEVSLVELKFTDFAGNISERWAHTNGVIDEILKTYDNPKILDAASGGGIDSVSLLQKGYEVTTNEVDPNFAKYLKASLQAAGFNPKVLGVDWRNFLSAPELKKEEFDIVFTLGNSFPNYLFKTSEREESLKGFWHVLKPGGTLFFDSRNYDYILRDAAKILEDPEHNFHYSYDNTYTNKIIKGFPVEITSEKVRLGYKHYALKTCAYLDLCPATIENVKSLIKNTLGNVGLKIYYDYKSTRSENFDFVQYVLKKN